MIAIADPPQITAETPQSDGQPAGEPTRSVRILTANQRKTLFTRENAREMSAKANAAKKARMDALRAAAEEIRLTPVPEEQYRTQRLARIREQLTELEGLLKGQVDWKAIKAISDAIARLSVIEQNLAMRPLPGSRRPGREKPVRSTGNASPLIEE